MKKAILRTEILENKSYVKMIHMEDGKDLVWKAPRPDSDLETQLREQFNEIFCGKVFDELIDSKLEPELYDLDQEFGITTKYIDQEWSPNRDLSSYTNSDKLNVFFGLEVWFNQQDRKKEATRHLRVKTNTDNTATICPIDNGFSLMGIDESKSDPGSNLNYQFIDELLSSSFITGAPDIETAIVVIDSVDVDRIVLDTATHFIGTCSFSPTIRQFIFGYSKRLIDYLEVRRTLLKVALEEWWISKKGSFEKPEVPANAIP